MPPAGSHRTDRRAAPSLRAPRRSFIGDERGVSMVEFALTMPLFAVIIGGVVVLSQALGAVQSTAQVASTVGDLTSQLQIAHPTDIADEFNVAAIMMAPLPTTSLSMRVTSAVPVMSGGTVASAAVGWCQAYGQGLPCPAKGTILSSFPNGASPPLGMLTSASSSFIVSEVSYTYYPPVASAIAGPVSIYKVKFLSPRTTDQVVCATC